MAIRNNYRGNNIIRTTRKVSIAQGNTVVAQDTSPQLGGFLDPDGNYIGMDKGGDISSASPLVIDTDGDYFIVTGTTSFSVMTVAANRHFFLGFAGALTITHGGGTIDIPGAANYTSAAGDVIECFSTAANVITIVGITLYSGKAQVETSNSVFGTLAVAGQSSVVADSTTDTLTLVGAGGTTITTTAGTDTITFTSVGEYAFKTLAVGGQTNIVADSTTDTLTLVGSNITITTDAGADTVTFTGPAAGASTGLAIAMAVAL